MEKQYMSRSEVILSFWRDIAPGIPKHDKPAIREAFNNYTDSLCKGGQISLAMYETITLNG